MKVLEQVDLRQNKLICLPPSIKSLALLEKLNLEDNPKFELPEGLGEKKSQTILTGAGIFSGRFVVSHADMRGKRWNMEDAVVTRCKYRSKDDEDFFAVYDGHGGDKASIYAAQRHPEILAEQLSELEAEKGVRAALLDEDDVIAAVRTSFIETSKEMTHDNIKRSGTTAIISLILGSKMYIANVGDSRAVCYRHGIATRVSLDHKPDLPEEEKRIRNLGGFVSPNGRVVGMLAVSRAFGDLDLQPFVSASPYINVVDITDMPDFLIIACDGVWDVISDKAACEVINSEPGDVVRAAMKLRDLAYLYGSQDNISVVVVKFKP